jgi:hypothetical protein
MQSLEKAWSAFILCINSVQSPFVLHDGKKTLVFLSSSILRGAVLWQGFLSDFVFITLGIGRQVQRIEDISYTYEQIRFLLPESCEAMWLDEEGRRLYAACSTMTSRGGWGANSLNLPARDPKGHVSAPNINRPSSDGMYGHYKLEITGNHRFATGDKEIDLNGFEC